jgi:hypothetical protein
MNPELKKARQQRHINNAIESWTNKKNGIYYSYETRRYTPEFCEEQILYFKNLKL